MHSRRLFLKGSALAMFGVGSMPAWLSRSLYAADSTDGRKKILVAIFQRGAVDGLNMVVPFGEPRYYELRPSIAIPKPDGSPNSAVDLDGFSQYVAMLSPASLSRCSVRCPWHRGRFCLRTGEALAAPGMDPIEPGA